MAATRQRYGRVRGWVPPEFGSRFISLDDGREWSVGMIYRRDQEVRLDETGGGMHRYVRADQLAREYVQAGS